MNEENMVDDLVAFLDNSIKKGVGHLRVETSDTLNELKKVETLGCMDCVKGNLACSVPTLHEGIDEYE